MCGDQLWQILVTSPEVLIFALFMVPDPRTVPDGQAARFVFGVLVALLSVFLLGPTQLEFWTKTAILASLVIACALRFALARVMAPVDQSQGRFAGIRAMSWRLPAAVAVVISLAWVLPISGELSTHGPDLPAGISDRSAATVTLHVGYGPGLGRWTSDAAAAALPPPKTTGPEAASAPVWVLPPIPTLTIPSNVTAFDPTVTPQSAATMAHDVVLDLVIESEARRTHDAQLAAQGATGDGLKEFTDVISDDVSAGKIVQKTYSFDQASLTLYLPKFATQAPRLVGVNLHGTTTLTTWDAAGNKLSQTTVPYAKSWGLGTTQGGGQQVIINDYTDLSLA
jgi:hypothetical protein